MRHVVIIGGGFGGLAVARGLGARPTGVELAGAVGEMSRFTLARDFRRIDPKLALILPTFSTPLASRAVRDLESLGVQV